MPNWKVVYVVDGIKHEVAFEDFDMASHFRCDVNGKLLKWQEWQNAPGGFWSRYF